MITEKNVDVKVNWFFLPGPGDFSPIVHTSSQTGTNSGSVKVYVAACPLPPGSYNGSITVHDPLDPANGKHNPCLLLYLVFTLIDGETLRGSQN